MKKETSEKDKPNSYELLKSKHLSLLYQFSEFTFYCTQKISRPVYRHIKIYAFILPRNLFDTPRRHIKNQDYYQDPKSGNTY